jgi:hypothetical protein
MPAIPLTVSERGRTVTTEQFEREKNYGASMAVARAMLSKGLINDRDYRKIDTIFKKKYRPVIGILQERKP